MHRRCDQHAFAIFCRKRKYRPPHMAAGVFIEKTVVPSPGSNVDLFSADHIVEFICINPRCIYDISGLKCPIICTDLISFFNSHDLLHFCIEFEINPVHVCVLRQRNIQAERAYDPGCRRIQSRIYILRNIRLHFKHFFPAQYLQTRHSVFNPFIIQSPKGRHSLFIPADNE